MCNCFFYDTNYRREIVLSYGPGHFVSREDLRSLGDMGSDACISPSVVDSWAMLLNLNEEAKMIKPRNFWFGPSHMVIDTSLW